MVIPAITSNPMGIIPSQGPGMDTRTNRGLGPDHPRIRTSRRGGRAETASSISVAIQ